ncbi:hypothetical protein [Mucilaginibacter sp. AK015]|uniref:hypothetical protein n=1 Tax=Mucilaginibacter sp. AK015 TaxID=2723072 RepID=UPI001620010E|nr:hypothetical protein [Mucilaginibacter sp. AK015]MBB5395638.1 hypothetical protein [Mucilaginibacter sp. AK015]
MAYNVLSGEIQAGILYQVVGAQSVIYNSSTYLTGQYFSGVVSEKTFTYSGTGTQGLNEILQFNGVAIEFDNEANISFFDTSILGGFAIEYYMNSDEQIINDITQISGFALELLDYPYYSFLIIEERL